MTINKQQTNDNDSLSDLWYRMDAANEQLKTKLLDFSDQADPGLMTSIWDEFHCFREYADEPLDKGPLIYLAFLHYYFYNWVPNEKILGYEHFIKTPLAFRYLTEHRNQLSNDEIAYIQANANAHYCFYQVLDANPGFSLCVRNLLTGREHVIQEKSESQNVQIRQVMVARVVSVESCTLFAGIFPHALPEKFSNAIESFKKRMGRPWQDEDIKDFNYDIRDYYYQMLSRVVKLKLDYPDDQEVEQFVAGLMARYWDQWPDAPLPQLQGLSPRQAAQTPEGLMKLEALFECYRRCNINPDANIPEIDVDALKATLEIT